MRYRTGVGCAAASGRAAGNAGAAQRDVAPGGGDRRRMDLDAAAVAAALDLAHVAPQGTGLQADAERRIQRLDAGAFHQHAAGGGQRADVVAC